MGVRKQEIRISGIVSMIDSDPNAGVKRNENGRFMEIPKSMADRFVDYKTNLPLRFEHVLAIPNGNTSIPIPAIGKVVRFYTARKSIEEDGETKERDVLMIDAFITNVAFITFLQQMTGDYNNVQKMGEFYSPDGFLSGGRLKKKGAREITAKSALIKRFPGLSIGHKDSKESDVVEVSLCGAGARPGTIITSVEYKSGDGDGIDNSVDKAQVSIFSRLINSFKSVKADIDKGKKLQNDVNMLKMAESDMMTYAMTISAGESRQIGDGDVTEKNDILTLENRGDEHLETEQVSKDVNAETIHQTDELRQNVEAKHNKEIETSEKAEKNEYKGKLDIARTSQIDNSSTEKDTIICNNLFSSKNQSPIYEEMNPQISGPQLSDILKNIADDQAKIKTYLEMDVRGNSSQRQSRNQMSNKRYIDDDSNDYEHSHQARGNLKKRMKRDDYSDDENIEERLYYSPPFLSQRKMKRPRYDETIDFPAFKKNRADYSPPFHQYHTAPMQHPQQVIYMDTSNGQELSFPSTSQQSHQPEFKRMYLPSQQPAMYHPLTHQTHFSSFPTQPIYYTQPQIHQQPLLHQHVYNAQPHLVQQANHQNQYIPRPLYINNPPVEPAPPNLLPLQKPVNIVHPTSVQQTTPEKVGGVEEQIERTELSQSTSTPVNGNYTLQANEFVGRTVGEHLTQLIENQFIEK